MAFQGRNNDIHFGTVIPVRGIVKTELRRRTAGEKEMIFFRSDDESVEFIVVKLRVDLN